MRKKEANNHYFFKFNNVQSRNFKLLLVDNKNKLLQYPKLVCTKEYILKQLFRFFRQMSLLTMTVKFLFKGNGCCYFKSMEPLSACRSGERQSGGGLRKDTNFHRKMIGNFEKNSSVRLERLNLIKILSKCRGFNFLRDTLNIQNWL